MHLLVNELCEYQNARCNEKNCVLWCLSFILLSVLRQIYSIFHSKFSTMWSSASSFIFQHTLSSLRSSSSCLELLFRLPITLSFPLSFLQCRILEGSSYSKCDKSRVFLFLLFEGHSAPQSLFATLLKFSDDRSQWSSPTLFSTIF